MACVYRSEGLTKLLRLLCGERCTLHNAACLVLHAAQQPRVRSVRRPARAPDRKNVEERNVSQP